MIVIAPILNDDADFLALVDCLAGNLVRQFQPKDLYLIRTNNWFDHKWLGFSGKGLVGVWKQRLTIPPLVIKRVLSQDVYAFEESDKSHQLVNAPPLHRVQLSSNNLIRFIDRVSKSGIFVWFCGGTEQSGLASILVYSTRGDSQSSWYASFRKSESWQLNKVKGFSSREILHLMIPAPPGSPTFSSAEAAPPT